MTGDAITSKIGKAGLKFLTPETGVILPSEFPPSESLKNYVRDGIREWVSKIEIDLKNR